MAKVTIFSYRCKNVVWPPYVVVTPGDEIVFKAVNTTAMVFFPNGGIFEAHRSGEAITLPVGGEQPKLKVRDGASPGLYPFSVYCENGPDFAEGNSSPVMIIEPPDSPGTHI